MNKLQASIHNLRKQSNKKLELKNVDHEWTLTKLYKLGIEKSTLREALQLDESSFSLLLNGKRGMSKAMKAAIYYYLAYREEIAINKEITNSLNEESHMEPVIKTDKVYKTQIRENTAIMAIKWLKLSIKENKRYHLTKAIEAIENDPGFNWEGLSEKLITEYNEDYKSALEYFNK